MMKKFLFVLVTVISLTSCVSMSGALHDPVPKEFDSLNEINTWIYYNIKYVARDSGNTIDTYQTPEETLMLRTGVCIDMAFLFVKLAEDSGFHGCKVLPIQYVKSGSYHCVVDTGLGIYDPTNNMCNIEWINYYPKWVITTWE